MTAGSRTLDLPDPFFVLATQNPIEQEGTYPLPEAQLDRFMFMVMVNYPEPRGRAGSARSAPPARRRAKVERVHRRPGDPASCRRSSAACRSAITSTTSRWTSSARRRPNEPGASDFVRHWLSWGAGPRRGQYMILAGKARALMHGRLYVTIEDIEAVAAPVLRHRIIPNFNAEAEGITVEQIIEKILNARPAGRRRAAAVACCTGSSNATAKSQVREEDAKGRQREFP